MFIDCDWKSCTRERFLAKCSELRGPSAAHFVNVGLFNDSKMCRPSHTSQSFHVTGYLF